MSRITIAFFFQAVFSRKPDEQQEKKPQRRGNEKAFVSVLPGFFKNRVVG
jgi:hypothetical protein